MSGQIEPKALVGLLEQLWHAGGALPRSDVDDGTAQWCTELDLVWSAYRTLGVPPDLIELTHTGRRVIRSKRRRFLRALIDADHAATGGHGLTRRLRGLTSPPMPAPVGKLAPPRKPRDRFAPASAIVDRVLVRWQEEAGGAVETRDEVFHRLRSESRAKYRKQLKAQRRRERQCRAANQ